MVPTEAINKKPLKLVKKEKGVEEKVMTPLKVGLMWHNHHPCLDKMRQRTLARMNPAFLQRV